MNINERVVVSPFLMIAESRSCAVKAYDEVEFGMVARNLLYAILYLIDKI